MTSKSLNHFTENKHQTLIKINKILRLLRFRLDKFVILK